MLYSRERCSPEGCTYLSETLDCALRERYYAQVKSFWYTLKRPFLCLAPMADVTDPAFREVIARHGKPDVFWTEFVSADGLYHTRALQKMRDEDNPLLKDLRFTPGERPIVAQVFTASPEAMEYAARLILELGFDGVDINMGCPHKPIEKQGAGAALIKHPELARELIVSAKKGVGGAIPVSVKTRIGYNRNELETWLPQILKEAPAAVTIHARTRKEMSNVPARWEHVKEAVRIRNECCGAGGPLILGNGDVASRGEVYEKAQETGADGVMIGRGIFGNPWLFSDYVPSDEERLRVLVEHCRLFDKRCEHKPFAVMKKHFKSYVQGFTGSKALRVALMEAQSTREVEQCVDDFLKSRV